MSRASPENTRDPSLAVAVSVPLSRTSTRVIRDRAMVTGPLIGSRRIPEPILDHDRDPEAITGREAGRRLSRITSCEAAAGVTVNSLVVAPVKPVACDLEAHSHCPLDPAVSPAKETTPLRPSR